MHEIDNALLALLNQAARHWRPLDVTIAIMGTNDFIKGAIVVALVWWAWFGSVQREDGQRARLILASALLGALASLVVTRFLTHVLPFRPRPLNDLELAFVEPFGMPATVLESWSSFPSDHAALYTGLATGLLLVRRSLGLAAAGYVLLVVCAPRVYLGLHYPSDIIAGAAIGAASVLAVVGASRLPPMQRLLVGALRWSERSPGAFYAGFFLLSFEMGNMFGDVRTLLVRAADLVLRAFHSIVP